MARLIPLFFFAVLTAPAAADEAFEACLFDALPHWQIEPAGGDGAYRATRLAPDPSWAVSRTPGVGTPLCDTYVVDAVPVRVSTVPGAALAPELAETWMLRFGDWAADVQGFIEVLGLGALAVAQDRLAIDVVSVGLTAPKGQDGLEVCDTVDFATLTARLHGGGGVPGYRVTEFAVENLSADPEHRSMMETLNPPLAACAVTFVVRTDGAK